MYNLPEICGMLLFFIGIYGLIARRNIIKTIISLGIMETGLILFFLSINYQKGQTPPIGITPESIPTTADPVVQALMITAIVIGVAVTAVSLSMFISMYHKYGTTNWKKAMRERIAEYENPSSGGAGK